jgi:hypothetical protein
MKLTILKNAVLLILGTVLTTGIATAQTMSFTVSTKNPSGSTGNANVFVLWITTSTGAYVKTINRQSKNYTSDLSAWCTNSGTKTTDGQTGATISSHNYPYSSGTTKRIPFTWDFKNYLGTVVANGTYYINIEFKEESTSRQYVKYQFTKGTTSYTQTLTGTMVTGTASCFTSPSLVYTAPTVALTPTEATDFEYIYSKSERSLQLEYDAASHNSIKLQLVNLKGQTVYTVRLKGSGKESVQLPDCCKGIYLLRLTDKEGWSQTKKLLL